MKKEFGIIGYPLGQSASPAFFNKKFKDEGIDAEYRPFEISEITELPHILSEHSELVGFNVTIPYKQQVMNCLDEISDEAKAIQAVNVVPILDPMSTPMVCWNSSIPEFTRPTSITVTAEED